MGVVDAGRMAAERRFGVSNGGSTATVWREDPTNPVIVGGLETPNWTAVHTDLPGRIAAHRGVGATRRTSIGQTEVQLAVREWHCPASTSGLRDGDVLKVTAGENSGLYFRIIEATGNDQSTARRVPVVEVQKPGGIA